VTSMADVLGYGWAVDDEIDLGNPAWMHELRGPDGEWIDTPASLRADRGEYPRPAPGPEGSVDRYVVPDPRRLIAKSGTRNPADHPFWQAHPVSPQNIIDVYDKADEGTRAQGRRWYSAVSDFAGMLAGGNREMGGILLSTYSPQTRWPINMMNAYESVRRGDPVGPGEGVMVSADQKAKAQKAMDGGSIEELMTTAKTHSFGRLIARGDDSPDDPYGHVVIDTHAVNIAAGGTIRGANYGEGAPIGDQRQHEYVADQYRAAAKIISEREGVLMKPHELQAITWLMQVQANEARDRWLMEHGDPGRGKESKALAKGRITGLQNAWKAWEAYAAQHGITTVPGVSAPPPQEPGPIAMSQLALLAQIIELVGGDSMAAQLLEPPPFPDGSLAAQALDLAFDPHEPRDRHGRWTKGLHPLDPYYNELPESGHRGTVRSKGTFGSAGSGREREDAGRLAAHRREQEYQQTLAAKQATRTYPEIGEEGARGDSRAVTSAEFQALARKGNQWIDQAKNHRAPIVGLEPPGWDAVKQRSYAEARKSWGGETIDTDTGEPLPQGADLYAISVKPRGMYTVSIPEGASYEQFSRAMDRAKDLFRPALERRGFYLGVFHDDDQGRIDIDPVAIVDSVDLVEQVGAYTRAIGGAYHFKSGNGFWPPHVTEGAGMANDDNSTHFEHGYAQWHTQAVACQEPEPDSDTDD